MTRSPGFSPSSTIQFEPTRLPTVTRANRTVLFGSTTGGCMLAGEALAVRDNSDGFGDPQRYVALARFFAENVSVQAPSLERTVMDSAEAVTGADTVLLG